MENKPSVELLSLCCLFIALKESYNDNPHAFYELAKWFGFDRDKIYIDTIPEWMSEDICAKCSNSFDVTLGGRLRKHCISCRNTEEDSLFYTYNLPNLAQAIGLCPEYLESHLADAIFLVSRKTMIRGYVTSARFQSKYGVQKFHQEASL